MIFCILAKINAMNNKSIYKFLILTLLSAFIFVSNGWCQNKFKLGLMGDLAVNSFKSNVDNLKSDKNGLGLGFGLISDFYFSENYSFGTGLGIINQSFGTAFQKTDTVETNQYKIRNLEMPMTLKFQSNPISNIRLVGNFGGVLGLNIFAKKTQEFKTTSGTFIPNKDVDASDDINLWNVQFIIGAGIFYPLNGDTGIEAMLNYKNGLTDILDGNSKSGAVNSIGLRLALIF